MNPEAQARRRRREETCSDSPGEFWTHSWSRPPKMAPFGRTASGTSNGSRNLKNLNGSIVDKSRVERRPKASREQGPVLMEGDVATVRRAASPFARQQTRGRGLRLRGFERPDAGSNAQHGEFCGLFVVASFRPIEAPALSQFFAADPETVGFFPVA